MSIKILIAEDDPDIQYSVKLILEMAGYETIVVSDSVPIYKNMYPPPDLFLLDKQLSGSDGLEVCKFLKGCKDTKDIPVVIISATPNLGVIAKAAGAEDYIEKPFRKQDLLNMVAKYTKRMVDL